FRDDVANDMRSAGKGNLQFGLAGLGVGPAPHLLRPIHGQTAIWSGRGVSTSGCGLTAPLSCAADRPIGEDASRNPILTYPTHHSLPGTHHPPELMQMCVRARAPPVRRVSRREIRREQPAVSQPDLCRTLGFVLG